MYKKFVPLNSNQSPSKNPYEVCTFMGEPLKPEHPEWKTGTCGYERDCKGPQNSTIAKVLTLEDEIRKIHKKAQENIYLRPFKKSCIYEDRFVTCVVPQRTPYELKRNAVMREKIIKIHENMQELVYDVGDIYSDPESLVILNEPFESSEPKEEQGNEEGGEGIEPEMASPQCSMDYIYVPPKRLLTLNSPKSGLYVNETQPPGFYPSDEIPYSTYNPRVLQEQFDAQYLKRIDVIPGKTSNDLWTWNVGLQQKESDLDRGFVEAAVAKFDCNNLDLAIYKIPKDLDKTFTARIVFGTKAIKLEPPTIRKSRYNRPTEIACIYLAYVEGFRLNPDFWTAATMDNIIKMGQKVIEKCTKMNYRSPKNDFDIITQFDDREAAIAIKVHFTGPLKTEPNIYKALTVYFSKYNACILCSSKLYLLIWKRCKNFYYIYDPNGRSENCERDFEKGKCALISTHFVEHVVHLIMNISMTNLEDEFNLYEINLTSFGRIPSPLPKKPYPKTFHKMWSVVNDSYAVIPGCNNGLFQPLSATQQNPSMLISVMAVLYSHIEKGSTWKPDHIDELIRLGTAYHKSLRRKLKLKDAQHVTINDVPDKYVLGTFKASLKKSGYMYTGTVTDYCMRYMDSLLTSGMKELFNSNWEAALVQIDNSVLAVWKDSELFYVYDPFRRGKAGQVLDPEDYKINGLPVLQMHANFESFLRTIYQNALKLRRGAIFFLHALHVGCIKPIMDGKIRKLRYPKLRLTPETYVKPVEKKPEDSGDNPGDEKKDAKSKGKKNKKDKKKDKLRLPDKVCSIESLDDKDRQPSFDDAEMVEGLLDNIVCEILNTFGEPQVCRPHLYKQAGRVLLRSDKEYLENLKYLVKHDEDYDNVEMYFRTDPDPDTPIISLEEELEIPSNFQTLPDGSWIIFGSQMLPPLDAEQAKVKGLLAAIVTVALSGKYKISTWSAQLIDYALNSIESFGKDFENFQYTLGVLLHKKFPKLGVGNRTFQVTVQEKINAHAQKPLRQVLMETLINYSRILVICQRFCCIVLKRYNFIYMFTGFSVNAVGYRKYIAGPACLLRFIELDSLIRRIEYGCNPEGCVIKNYVVIPVKVLDITPDPMGRYKQWPAKVEDHMYHSALEEKTRAENSRKMKLQFLDDEIKKENQRIQEFLKGKENNLKKSQTKSGTISTHGTSEPSTTRFNRETAGEDAYYELNSEEGEEEECIVEPKHEFGTQLPKGDDEFLRPTPILYGYRMRETDLLYKIQGSKALEGRDVCELEDIKPCLFASSMAVLYAILKPLNEWPSERIDKVIDSCMILMDTVEDMSNSHDRILKNVAVDDYKFDIWIKEFEPVGLIGNLHKQLERITKLRKYVVMQTVNCSYAICKDEYFHLFDPYRTMQLMGAGEEQISEDQQEMNSKCPDDIKCYEDKNTASWILFADIRTMLKYMDERACSPTWKEDGQYLFFVVDIISYKKAPQSAYVLQLLTGMSPCSVRGEQENSVCAHNESISWLEHCLPVWSRLNRRNTAGRYRGMDVSKLKKYDIEIDNRLWSLWGNLHPQAPVFDVNTRGKQYLACCIISLCAAHLYRLTDWSSQLLDSIVINGDRYVQQSLQDIKCEDYPLGLEDLSRECLLENVQFVIHVEPVAFGKLYSRPYYNRMNLAEGLMYFFKYFQFGILQCFKKCLAIGYMPGHDGGYFMFDCQSRDHPLFPKGQGAPYVLRTKYLQILLYCVVVTLNVPYYNVQFNLHKVDILPKDQMEDAKKAEEETKN